MGQLVAVIEIFLGIVGYLLGIALFWHLRRIGKAWIAWTFWSLQLVGMFAVLAVAVLASADELGVETVLGMMLMIAMIGGVLTAPLHISSGDRAA